MALLPGHTEPVDWISPYNCQSSEHVQKIFISVCCSEFVVVFHTSHSLFNLSILVSHLSFHLSLSLSLSKITLNIIKSISSCSIVDSSSWSLPIISYDSSLFGRRDGSILRAKSAPLSFLKTSAEWLMPPDKAVVY